MIVGYARVSTLDQDCTLQRVALTEAGCERIFEETASGAQRDRPELIAALGYVRPGDTLVVWKLDRLARSLRQLMETVEGLEAKEISFRTLTENIDTSSAGGRLVFHLFAALAEFERGLIRERTLAGLAVARSRGRRGGRPKSLSDQDLLVAKALLMDGQLTVAEVAERVGVSQATFYRHLPSARSTTVPAG